jgi:hypothetical protein
VDSLSLRRSNIVQKRCVRTLRTIRAILLSRSDSIACRSATTTMSVTANTSWNPFRKHVLDSVVEETTPSAPVRMETKSKTWTTTVDRVPSWPEEARPLKRRDWVHYLFVIGDVILVLLPIYFICELIGRSFLLSLMFVVLGVAVVTLNRKAVEGNAFASKVTSAIQLVSEPEKSTLLCYAD